VAKMYPVEIREDTASDAERDLYRLFREQLSDDYHVMHSVRWTKFRHKQHNRQGEADFVIVSKKIGVLFLEVKGGQPELRNGRWYSFNRSGNEDPLVRGPAEQASDSMHALMERAARTRSTERYIRQYRYQHAVAFPDINARGKNWGPDCPQEIIIDSTDLHDLERGVLRLAGEIRPNEQASDDAIDALVKLFQPDTRVEHPGLASEMFASATKLDQLTDEQYAVIDSLHHQAQLAIPGVAGSGKTLLAIKKAEFLAQSGYRVLLTCFNRSLGDWLQTRVYRHADIPPGSIRVANFDSLAEQLVDESGLERPRKPAGRNQNAYYETKLPELVFDHAGEIDERFDAIIVDEGQDFTSARWTALQALMSDPVNGVFYIFFDSHQGIYQKAHQFPVRVSDVALLRNCRNTNPIHELLVQYYHGNEKPRSSEVPGQEPEIYVVPSERRLKTIQSVFNRLFNVEKIPLKNAVVLTFAREGNSALQEGHILGKYTLTWGAVSRPDHQVQVRTVHSFKGLERPIVILVVEIDHIPKSQHDTLLYVALSRATQHLVVVGALPEPQGTFTHQESSTRESARPPASKPLSESATRASEEAPVSSATSTGQYRSPSPERVDANAEARDEVAGRTGGQPVVSPESRNDDGVAVGEARDFTPNSGEPEAPEKESDGSSSETGKFPEESRAITSQDESGITEPNRVLAGPEASDASTNSLTSTLCYVVWFIVPIMVLGSSSRSKAMSVHAYQGLVFAGLSVGYYATLTLATLLVVSLLPLLMCILWVAWIIPAGIALYYASRVYTRGQTEFVLLSDITRSLFKELRY
jgi:hypothetical protein